MVTCNMLCVNETSIGTSRSTSNTLVVANATTRDIQDAECSKDKDRQKMLATIEAPRYGTSIGGLSKAMNIPYDL